MKYRNQNQRKICLCLLSGLLFFMMSILTLFSAYAENNRYSLTLHCEAEGDKQTTAITNDEFAIINIADVTIDKAENTYNLHYVTLEKYKNDVPQWEDISASQMRDMAERLSRKVQSKDYLDIQTTDSKGNAVFSSLRGGLYLVIRTRTTNADYIFEPFIVSVPQTVNGILTEDVVSSPKFEQKKPVIPKDQPVVPNTPSTVVTTTGNNGDYLPQTGQIVVPVFIFLGLGVVCVTAGIILYITGKNDE